MTAVFALFTALANIKAIAGYIETFASAVTIWYVQRQKAEVLAAISNAAALAARAQNDDERYKSAQAWMDALGKPRTLP